MYIMQRYMSHLNSSSVNKYEYKVVDKHNKTIYFYNWYPKYKYIFKHYVVSILKIYIHRI